MPMDVKLPQAFQERFTALLGDEFEAFLHSLSLPSASFVRINTLKIALTEGRARLANLNIQTTPLPWFPAGFRVSGAHERLPFSREYGLGYVYVQEGASMIPPVALIPEPTHRVLDLCAAPGSKTTQLAQIMENQGSIIANDRTFRRITSLGHNLQLCGVANTIVLCEDGRWLPKILSLQFDRVLVDVPCTASGHLRSKPPQYDPPDKKRLSGLQTLQKGLITGGFHLLKPGGLLVYSTCSLYPEENEDVIQHLLDRFSEAILLRIRIPGLISHTGLTEWDNRKYNDTMERCLRIYPHDNDTDGFFLSLIRKSAGSV